MGEKRGPRNAGRTRLKAVRVAAGMTQAELSERASIPIKTVQALECGGRDINKASVELVLRLCVVLGCKVADVLEGAAAELATRV